jgi:hypothetical protein
MGDIEDIVRRVSQFERAAHLVLSSQEAAPSRVIALSETRNQVTILNLKQSDLLVEGLRAMESGLYRPAIIMAWAAFMDFLQERLASDSFATLYLKRPNWAKWKSLEDLRENVTEFQLLDVARDVGLLSKSETKALHGLLSKRNECAHPSNYRPNLNEALGYVSELLNRIPIIGQRSLSP